MCLAVPGLILDVKGDDLLTRKGRVSFGGVVREISLACTPDAAPGAYVLVHAGLALNIVDESEARRVFQYLDEMGELETGPS